MRVFSSRDQGQAWRSRNVELDEVTSFVVFGCDADMQADHLHYENNILHGRNESSVNVISTQYLEVSVICRGSGRYFWQKGSTSSRNLGGELSVPEA